MYHAFPILCLILLASCVTPRIRVVYTDAQGWDWIKAAPEIIRENCGPRAACCADFDSEIIWMGWNAEWCAVHELCHKDHPREAEMCEAIVQWDESRLR